MKITVILLLVASLHVCAGGYAQGRVTLSEDNVPLSSVLRDIAKQTGYQYFFVDQWMKETKAVTIHVQNGTLKEVLDLCFKDQPFSYAIVQKTIVVSQKPPATDTVRHLPEVKGRVVNDQGEALVGVSIAVKGENKVTLTDKDGLFTIKDVPVGARLQVSFVGYETQEIQVSGAAELFIRMKVHISQIEEVVLTGSDGYQTLTPERSAGSYNVVDNALVDRSVTTNILDRLENLVPGLLFNHGDAPDPYLIRGRSTIYANAAPLIVLDNFPYDGDLGNINPNDVESVTVLKDAAAAAIWGARSGNGVIVITTKRGKTARPTVNLNSSVNVLGRPDLFSLHTISSPDYIGLEQNLFSQGYYTNDQNYTPETPVITLLKEVQNGTLTAAQANAQIDAFKGYDVRNDEKKYLYRTGVNQQHSVNVSGSTPNVNYYLSAGWDHNLNNLVASQNDRISLRTLNTFKVSRDLQVDAGINYTQTIAKNGNNPGSTYVSPISGKSFYPYAQLADAKGNPLPVYTDYQQSYLDTAGGGGLLDWTWKPIADIYNENNTTTTEDFVVNVGLRYRIFKGLSAEVKYQYENSPSTDNNYYSGNSYYARNMINSFTQGYPGNFSYPLPVGGILYVTNSGITSHQGRAQLSYTAGLGSKDRISAIGGYEIRSAINTGSSGVYYGYNPDDASVISNIDFTTQYPMYYEPYLYNQVQNVQSVSKTTDHFLSYYLDASDTYMDRYILSGSARKDEANLFGVSANLKGVPLWSLGGGWILSKEKFYTLSWLPYLKARATYGYNGNISRVTSALTTIKYFNGGANQTPLAAAAIENPPNPNLRWEMDGITNFGLDFALKRNVISGTVEYYLKNDKSLMGQAPADPTWGLAQNGGQSFYFGNVANMKGKGVDMQLNTRNTSGAFKWETHFILSYSTSRITRYLLPLSTQGSVYLQDGVVNPVQGKPVFSMYSYKWGGLDPTTGDPLGYQNGKTSNSWGSLITVPLDSMVYNGSAQPTWFGALRNDFTYRNFTLSVNISYKLGYYFRTPSVQYGSLFSNWTGNSDYAARWQNPGDEKKTHVPSMVYPDNPSRDGFYEDAQVLVQRADNIRLEDASLSYDMDRVNWRKLPFSHVKIFVYATFPRGVLWQASKYGYDPYYTNQPKPGNTLAGGLNITF